MKSWLIRYKIPFHSINPYLTLYSLDNVKSISDLTYSIKETKKDIIYKPMGTITIEDNILRLDYVQDDKYNSTLENIFNEMNINVINKYCHVNIFKIKTIPQRRIFEDMMYSCPRIPSLRLGYVGLLRRRR